MSVTNPAAKPGILDHLADGMSLVVAKPQIALIPIVLDVAFSLTPAVSGETVSTRAGQQLVGSGSSALNQLGSWLTRQEEWGIERALALFVPSVVDGITAEHLYRPFALEALLPGWVAGAILLALAVLLGALLFIAFETWLAVSSDLLALDRSAVARALGRSWLSFVGFGLLVVAVLLAATGLLLAPGLISSGGGLSGDTVLGFLSLLGVAMLVATLFVPEAIVLDRQGPVGAIRSSLRVVSENFWQSMGFFAVSMLISPGLLSIWEEITGSGAGLAVAIVLNAGMVTSLALASLGFYRARSGAAA